MLFNSYDFLFFFLPVCLAGHHLLRHHVGPRAAWVWLTLASFVFYAWWYVPYLALLLASMAGNYGVGHLVADEARSDAARRRWLQAGVAANLAVLGWFKYAGFLDQTLAAVLGVDLGLPQVALPLAISFFTFQQIAYLADARKGRTRDQGPLDYVVFVSFFPQLIAGPIVHHREILPQVRAAVPASWTDRSVGLTLLALGLAKKVWIADTLGPVADAIFGEVHAGEPVTVLHAWTGILCFFFQVYFDFSGYSDMATGLARMFGIRLPVNFDAPYRSESIVDFWERWHITLSRFLRDYLYIPLGGNRLGPVRRYANLMVTMLLGGLWHGASWTFVAWGGTNGVYLMLNHAWRAVHGGPATSTAGRLASRGLTLVALVASYVYFRAETFADATTVHLAMLGITPAGLGSVPSWLAWTLLAVFALTQLAPTSQRWLEHFEPVLGRLTDTLRWPERFTWRPTLVWSLAIGLLLFACIPALERADAFVYWAF